MRSNWLLNYVFPILFFLKKVNHLGWFIKTCLASDLSLSTGSLLVDESRSPSSEAKSRGGTGAAAALDNRLRQLISKSPWGHTGPWIRKGNPRKSALEDCGSTLSLHSWEASGPRGRLLTQNHSRHCTMEQTSSDLCKKPWCCSSFPSHVVLHLKQLLSNLPLGEFHYSLKSEVKHSVSCLFLEPGFQSGCMFAWSHTKLGKFANHCSFHHMERATPWCSYHW